MLINQVTRAVGSNIDRVITPELKTRKFINFNKNRYAELEAPINFHGAFEVEVKGAFRSSTDITYQMFTGISGVNKFTDMMGMQSNVSGRIKIGNYLVAINNFLGVTPADGKMHIWKGGRDINDNGYVNVDDVVLRYDVPVPAGVSSWGQIGACGNGNLFNGEIEYIKYTDHQTGQITTFFLDGSDPLIEYEDGGYEGEELDIESFDIDCANNAEFDIAYPNWEHADVDITVNNGVVRLTNNAADYGYIKLKSGNLFPIDYETQKFEHTRINYGNGASTQDFHLSSAPNANDYTTNYNSANGAFYFNPKTAVLDLKLLVGGASIGAWKEFTAPKIQIVPNYANLLNVGNMGRRMARWDSVNNEWDFVLHSIFTANRKQGVWLDFSPENMYEDTLSSIIPVDEIADPVGIAKDLSGNGNNGVQTTATARPIYEKTPANGVRNLLVYTEDLLNPAWEKSSLTVTPVDNAFNIAFNALSFGSIQLVEGEVGSRTISIDLKYVDTPFMHLFIEEGADNRIQINLLTKTINSVGSNILSNSLVNLLDGWVRLTIAANTTILSKLKLANSNLNSQVSNVLVRYPQLEAGLIATPYQKVVSANEVSEYGVIPNNHVLLDKIDDNLIINFPEQIIGTMLLGTADGIIHCEVDIPAGDWLVAPTPTQFPGNSITALIISDGIMTEDELANAKSQLVARGCSPAYRLENNKSKAFMGRTEITKIYTDNWVADKVTDLSYFFHTCPNADSLVINHLDLSNVTTMAHFANTSFSAITTLDLTGLDFSSCTLFRYAFYRMWAMTTLTAGNAFDNSPCVDYTAAFKDLALDQPSVDSILISINKANTSNGVVDIDTGTSAIPSIWNQGQAAVYAMQNRGWAVTTNEENLYFADLWLDFSDPEGLFTTSGGTDIVSNGSAVGLVTDRSKGVDTSNTITTAQFNSIADWTYSGDVSVANNKLIMATTPELGSVAYPVDGATLIAGKSYLVKVNATRISGTGALIFCHGLGNNLPTSFIGSIDESGLFTGIYTPNENVSNFGIKRLTISQSYTWEIDEFTVSEITGSFGRQYTATARPVFNETPNRVVLDKVDDNLSIYLHSAITGTMLIGTVNGTVHIEVDIPIGEWNLVNAGIHFPGDNVIGVIAKNGIMSAGELADAKAWLADRGSPEVYTPTVSPGFFNKGFNNWGIVTSLPQNIDFVNAVSMFRTFATNAITEIPVGYLDNAVNLAGLQTTFYNNLLTSIPANLLQYNTNLVNVRYAFAINNIVAVPSSLFDNAALINAGFVFYANNTLTTVPANLFDTQTVCTDYDGAFTGTNLTQQSIDNVLVSIAYSATTNTLSNGLFDQTGGSAPSVTGEAAIDSLRALGWTINVTGGY